MEIIAIEYRAAVSMEMECDIFIVFFLQSIGLLLHIFLESALAHHRVITISRGADTFTELLRCEN